MLNTLTYNLLMWLVKGKANINALRTSEDDFSLTFDGGLKPAIEVSQTTRQKADEIFNEEVSEVIEDASRPPPPSAPPVWLNTQG